jgi:phage-related protein
MSLTAVIICKPSTRICYLIKYFVAIAVIKGTRNIDGRGQKGQKLWDCLLWSRATNGVSCCHRYTRIPNSPRPNVKFTQSNIDQRAGNCQPLIYRALSTLHKIKPPKQVVDKFTTMKLLEGVGGMEHERGMITAQSKRYTALKHEHQSQHGETQHFLPPHSSCRVIQWYAPQRQRTHGKRLRHDNEQVTLKVMCNNNS